MKLLYFDVIISRNIFFK